MAQELNEGNFEQLAKTATKPVIIKAMAAWCGPCQQMAPIFEELAQEYADTVDFLELDVDKARDLSIELGITSVPTTIFMKSGETISKDIGSMSKEDLKAKIEAFIK